MATLGFPSSPSTGTQYTVGDRTWVWTGQGWKIDKGSTTLDNLSVSQLTVTTSTNSIGTTSGGLIVYGGASIGQDLYVGGKIVANELDIQLTTITTTLIVTDDVIQTLNTSNAVDYTSGALQIAGGASIGKDLYVGNYIHVGGIFIPPNTTTNSTIYTPVDIRNETSSTSITSGALTVLGGVGISGDLHVGNIISNGLKVLTSNDGNTGFVSRINAGDDISVSTNTGVVTVNDISTLQSVTNRGNSTTTKLFVTNDTESTSSDSGAVQISGGVGVLKNIFAGGTVFADTLNVRNNSSITGILTVGSVVINSTDDAYGSTNSGALQVLGGIGVVGNIYAGGDMYARGYRVNTGTFTGGVLINNTKIVSSETSTSTDSGALQVVGGVGIGGDLYVGNSGSFDYISVRGTTTSTVAGELDVDTLIVKSSTISIGTDSGALQVAGGVGIGGNLYVGDTSYINGAQILTTATVNQFANQTTIYAGTDTAIDSNAGVNTIWNISTLQTITDRGNSTTNAIIITDTSTGALQVAGGVGIGKDLAVTGTINGNNLQVTGFDYASTVSGYLDVGILKVIAPGIDYFDASSTDTGAFQVLGGGGIGLNLWVGRNLHVAGTAFMNNAEILTTQSGFSSILGISVVNQTLQINTVTNSTSTDSGALQVVGGVGIGGDLYVGGSVTVNGALVLTTSSIGNAAVTSIFAGTDTAINNSTGAVTIWNTSTLQTITNRGNTTTNAISITNTDSAISTNSGALQVAGGVGIGGNLYVGGEIVAEKLTIQFTTVTTTLVKTDDIIQTYNTTNASSTDSGALQVVGGVGIGGDVYVGGSLYQNGQQILTTASVNQYANQTTIIAGTDTALSTSTGNITIWNTSNLQTITDRGNSTTNAILITNATSATSTNSGALQITGGAGVGGNLYVGKNANINGSLTLAPVVWSYLPTTFTGIPVTYGQTSLTFTLEVDDTITNMSVSAGAGGYGPGSVNLVIPGTTFPGGTSPANDIVFEVQTFESPGPVYSTAINSTVSYVSGTLPPKYDSIKSTGNVGIGAENSHWTFGTDGVLTLPDAGLITSVSGGIDIYPSPGQLATISNYSGYNQLSAGDTTVSIQTSPSNAGATFNIWDFDTSGNLTNPGKVFVLSTTNSVSSTTGALQVAGGVGIRGDVYIGGTLYQGGNQVLTNANVNQYANQTTITEGTDTAVSTSTGNITIWNTSTLESVTGRGNTTSRAIRINNTLTSTSSFSENALYVAGGIGGNSGFNINGDGYLQGNLNVTGYITGTNLVLNVLSANSGTFYGDVTGSGALYAGVLGHTPFDQTMAQFTGNLNDYMEINVQNINSGNWASTDIVASADNVSESNAFIDMGITSSGWDGTAPATFGDNLGPNDGYLLVGHSEMPTAGHLVIGTLSSQTSVKIVVAGENSEYLTAVFNTATTKSISTTTGALVVRGGVGIGGDLYVAGKIVAQELDIQLTTVTTTLLITDDIISTYNTTEATSTNTGALQVAGGVGIGGDLYVGRAITATSVGVTGSVNIGGNLSVGGTFTATAVIISGQAVGYGYSGSRGYDGSGIRGYDGSASTVRGPQGPLGYYGSQGDPGLNGNTGPQGPQGFAGSRGFDGSRGFYGSTGYDGSIGSAGFTGSRGVAGDSVRILGSTSTADISGFNYVDPIPTMGDGVIITSTGRLWTYTGATGGGAVAGFIDVGPIVGPQGCKGFTGSVGATGPQGVSGPTGPLGYYGSIGATGYWGSIGCTGFTGSKGCRGFIGVCGPQGPQGYSGSIGPSGPTGPTGYTGSSANLSGTTSIFTITNVTSATSTSSGALQVYGGAGIAGNLYVGGSIFNADGQAIGSNSTGTTSTFTILNTTSSTSTNTGALQVRGGAGIGGDLYVGGTIYGAGGQALGTNSTGTTSTFTILNTTSSTSTTTGALVVRGGVGIGQDVNIGGSVQIGSTSSAGSISGLSSLVASNITVTGSLIAPGLNFGTGTFITPVVITNKTASTSTNSGALIVTGGVGIGENLNVGQTLTVGTTASSGSITGVSSINAQNIIVTGSLTAPNLNINNSGTFTTPITVSTTTNATSTGTGALIVSGGAGFGGTVYANSFVTDGGLGSISGVAYITTLYLTATNAISITSKTSATSTTTGALIVTGGAGFGGDLYIGGNIYGSSGQAINATSTGTTSTFIIRNITASTGTTTGALIVQGGAGIGGDLYVGGQIFGPNGIPIASTGTTSTYAISNTANSTSTTTGALVVAGGVGIGGNLYVSGEIVAQKLTIQLTTVTTTFVQTDDIISTYNTTASTGTNSGALQVAGGVGIGGNLYIGNTATIASNVAAISTSSAALTVRGGVGVGGDLYVGGNIYGSSGQAINATSTGTTSTFFINNTIASTSTNTGGLIVGGGAGIAGNLNVGGNIVGGGVRSSSTSTAPSNPTIGDIWYNTITDDIYRYTSDGSSSYWLDISGPVVTNITAYNPIPLIYRLDSAVIGNQTTSPQTAFGVGVNLAANTVYQFEAVIALSKSAGAVTHITSILFGGTATLNNIGYWLQANSIASTSFTDLTNNASYEYYVQTAAAFATNATQAAATTVRLWKIHGTVSVNAGGTFIPQYQLSAGPGGAYTTAAGSYIQLTPIGTAGSNVAIGLWS